MSEITEPGAFAVRSLYNLREWKRGLERKKGEKWLVKGEIRIWSGKRWNCKHNRTKSACKKCGGSSICEHNCVKGICKECGGSQICIHNRRKAVCKECGGNGLCEHKREKSKCKECGGISFCEHGRYKPTCKECGGSSICIHNRIKFACKECGGSSICIHNRCKARCKECFGSQICIHNLIKSGCRECGGSAICEHNRRKSNCIECGGSRICKICKSKTGNPKYNRLCVTCAIQKGYTVCRNYKTKELSMVEFITDHTDVDWVNDKAHDLGCSLKRADLVCDLGSHIVIIECDENKHPNYTCENKRIMEISQDFSEDNVHRPVVVIRFNPDSYTNESGEKIPSCWKAGKDGILRIDDKVVWDMRLNKLVEVVEYHLLQVPTKHITIEELFYGI